MKFGGFYRSIRSDVLVFDTAVKYFVRINDTTTEVQIAYLTVDYTLRVDGVLKVYGKGNNCARGDCCQG